MACFSYRGKSVFYEECGQGTPLIFLHGNTASSKLFLPILALYSGRYRCICPDFLGNGRSDRVEAFPTDLWQDEGRQVIALIRHLNCGKACLVGTSGGAWAALNAALECPELICAVVADSFDGARCTTALRRNWRRSGKPPKRTRRRGPFTNGVRARTGRRSSRSIQRR